MRNLQYSLWQAGSSVRNYTNLKGLYKEMFWDNVALMNENRKLKDQLDKYKGCEFSNNFESLIRSKDSLLVYKGSYDFMWAKVIKNSINSTHNYIIIDKGAKDGILNDMGVIMPNGVVGIVRNVGKNYSYIVSFLNSSQQISAKVGKTDAFGTMSWDKKNTHTCVLNDIPQHISINAGDTVYTSGKSSFFPENIPIGLVKDSKIINGTHRAVNVKLFLNYSTLDYVIVAKNVGRAEIDSLSTIIIDKI